MTDENSAQVDRSDEQALIVHLRFADGDIGGQQERQDIFALEDRVIQAIDSSGIGEYDGNEMGGGEFTMYIYGPDAKQLLEIVSPLMEHFQPRAGSYFALRYGKPGAKEHRVPLSNSAGSLSN